MAKMSITFDGFDKLAEAIDRVGGDLHKAADEALTETSEIVSENLTTAAAMYNGRGKGLKGYSTGAMYRAIRRDADVEWSGSVAEVGVGFTTNGGSTTAGFMHSIFVMYGTPRMAKDPKIYAAIKGTRTRKEIEKAQEEIMLKHLALVKG